MKTEVVAPNDPFWTIATPALPRSASPTVVSPRARTSAPSITVTFVATAPTARGVGLAVTMSPSRGKTSSWAEAATGNSPTPMRSPASTTAPGRDLFVPASCRLGPSPRSVLEPIWCIKFPVLLRRKDGACAETPAHPPTEILAWTGGPGLLARGRFTRLPRGSSSSGYPSVRSEINSDLSQWRGRAGITPASLMAHPLHRLWLYPNGHGQRAQKTAASCPSRVRTFRSFCRGWTAACRCVATSQRRSNHSHATCARCMRAPHVP